MVKKSDAGSSLLPLHVRQRVAVWSEWASAEPMRTTIVGALAILDRDKDAIVHLDDLAARAESQRHKLLLHSRTMRELFAELESKGGADKETRHAHIKQTLESLTPEDMADVLAELPRFLTKQSKPLAVRLLGDKRVADVVTTELNALLVRMGAPNVTLNTAQGLLAAWGDEPANKGHSR